MDKYDVVVAREPYLRISSVDSGDPVIHILTIMANSTNGISPARSDATHIVRGCRGRARSARRRIRGRR